MLLRLLPLLPAIARAAFTPCPLLGPRFPKPTDVANSPVIQKALGQLKSVLDEGVTTSNTSNGPIYPNTTTFSITIFDASPIEDQRDPFFFQYHHTAPSLQQASIGTHDVDADSVYRIGGLTEVFNIWTFLAEAGAGHWHESMAQWVPQLAAASAPDQAVDVVDWTAVTLGDLASHLGGIERDCGSSRAIDAAGIYSANDCSYNRSDFLSTLASQPPAYPPGETPLKSIAGFQILSYALEAISGKSFPSILAESITGPSNMTRTSLTAPEDTSNAVVPGNETASFWSLDLGNQAVASGMFSTVSDLAKAGKAIMSSSILPSAVTRRWLKPVSHTSNVVNSVGMPWEIYTAVSEITDPVIDAYTARGNFGLYSSYFGLVPDYNVGFAILAADTSSNADLNAYADLVSDVIPAFEALAQKQAKANYAGSYSTGPGTLFNLTTDSPKVPGMSVDALMSNGVDVKAQYAGALGIGPTALSLRLYPTQLRQTNGSGQRVAFRAVFQDMDALVDQGTPTCETWREANQLFNGTAPADLFVFRVDGSGRATAVEIPALGDVLPRL